jgi:CheY-like chemotaxis protein
MRDHGQTYTGCPAGLVSSERHSPGPWRHAILVTESPRWFKGKGAKFSGRRVTGGPRWRAPSPHLPVQKQAHDLGERSTRQVTVILVDDADDLRALYRLRMDRTDDFRVLAEAANGLEGLAAARAHNPDLVLLDISMPVMDGLQALPLIREACPATNVVMVTAHGTSTGLRERTEALGSAGYIIKGIPMAAMLEELRRIVAVVHPTAHARDRQPDRDQLARFVEPGGPADADLL